MRELGKRTEHDVMDLRELDQMLVALAGGKGAQLGALARITGIRVPNGFCVTTNAFERMLVQSPEVVAEIDALARLAPSDHDAIAASSAELRRTIRRASIPSETSAAITRALAMLGRDVACAVRSSATAEDLPTASFAGQHDTYLNVAGATAVLAHVSRCWASLFTERAVTYRMRNGIEHRGVRMAVVVQAMVTPHAAGVLFTADPVSGNRTIAVVEATLGLGEELVSGRVTPDRYRVRHDAIVSRTVSPKPLTVVAGRDGGTVEEPVPVHRQMQSALSDAQVVHLVQLGRRIEAHVGHPHDIEWCLVDDEFHFVQSRPITTLFPLPDSRDEENHVYLSVGHNQMMTDAIKPLGLSFWQMTTPRPMAEAGGRLFVDVAAMLAMPASRDAFLLLAGRTDPLVKDALQTVLDRGDFIRGTPVDAAPSVAGPWPPTPIDADPAIPAGLIARNRASVEKLKADIRGRTGTALLDFIQADLLELKRLLFEPESHRAAMAGMEATWWLNEQLHAWLGETNAADALAHGAPNNVTSEMGLALLDVADAIRPYPEAVAVLQRVTRDDFADELITAAGGREAYAAIAGWLDTYGMRGVGEIDITRPRYAERPSALVPMILGHVRHFDPGERARRLAHGERVAHDAEARIMRRVRELADGERKANDVQQMIDQLRIFIGYREYPKFGKVSRTAVYRQALLDEADRLVGRGVIAEREDMYFLRFDELRDVVREGTVDAGLIRRRKDEFESYQSLRPPRVLTSEGEAINGSLRRDDLPAGALSGIAVSAGTVEGRARVILDIANARLEPGDILVTVYTDPSWTPFFVAIGGLVTEVGGVMTHGAVIAREYGLPAVVGVADATRVIRDGDRIRVHGTEGYVEIIA